MNKDVILKGKNIIRWILIFIAIFLLIISLFNIDNLKIFAIFPILISLSILLLIQFPKLMIDKNVITFEKVGLIKGFNLKESFKLRDIEGFEYIKGDETSSLIYKLILSRNGGFGERTKPDQLILKFKNGKMKILQKINSKEKFNEFINKLDVRLKSTAPNNS